MSDLPRMDDYRALLHMLIGKWKLEILQLLSQRDRHFGDLHRSLGGITRHTLTTRLRELEADGLIERLPHRNRVYYRVTSKTRSLRPVCQTILEWCAHQRMEKDTSIGNNTSTD